MIFKCCDEKRKAAVLGNPTLNGIDYLEVLGFDAQPLGLAPQTILLVRCLKTAPTALTPANILISGGESITNIQATFITPATTPPATMTAAQQSYFTSLTNPGEVLVIGVSTPGDFSPYLLRLVNSAAQASEDPFQVTEVLERLRSATRRRKVFLQGRVPACFRLQAAGTACPPDLPPPPPINYLAKDYGSFRSVILDRLSQLLPTWGATSEADIGIALAELLAYLGDSLSYKQDAVATEAYLQTARSRVSLRRHALLVDYHVHDGCNARSWMHLEVSVAILLDGTKTRFYTKVAGRRLVGRRAMSGSPGAGVVIFEGMQAAQLFPEHNQMSFYTWGDNRLLSPERSDRGNAVGHLEESAAGRRAHLRGNRRTADRQSCGR